MKKLLSHPLIKILTNKYVLSGLSFAFWMVFLDTNNYFIHSELDQQLDNLERDIDYYQSTLKEDRVLLEQLETDPKAFERYARENFGMLKKGETITIIEFEDSSNE
jgi:cell division protein DivIC